jgi:hypothetical protein
MVKIWLAGAGETVRLLEGRSAICRARSGMPGYRGFSRISRGYGLEHPPAGEGDRPENRRRERAPAGEASPV